MEVPILSAFWRGNTNMDAVCRKKSDVRFMVHFVLH